MKPSNTTGTLTGDLAVKAKKDRQEYLKRAARLGPISNTVFEIGRFVIAFAPLAVLPGVLYLGYVIASPMYLELFNGTSLTRHAELLLLSSVTVAVTLGSLWPLMEIWENLLRKWMDLWLPPFDENE